MVDTARAERGGGIWSGRYLPVTLANLTVVALVAFDALAVVAALPTIAEDLGSVTLLPWVVTAYLATSGVATIVAGPVIDAIGVRRTFRVTGLWFIVANAAGAAAPTMPLLIVARAGQGIGGGLLLAVAMSAVGLAYPHGLRPKAFAANSVVWGMLGFGSPAVAGTLLAAGSWRFVFVIQVPLTALALAVGWRTLPSTRERPTRIRTDRRGVALLAGLLASSLLAVGQIGVTWWGVVLATLATVAFAAAYWWHSGRADEPVLARRHLTRLPLGLVHLTAGLALMSGLAANNYLPLYLQTTRDRSVEFAAFSLLFLTVGWTLGSIVYSRALDTWQEADVIMLGALMIPPSVGVTAVSIAVDGLLAVLLTAFFLIGLSIGFVSTAGLTLIQSISDPKEIGRVNAAHQFIRTLGITYGVALGGAVLLLVVDLRVGDVAAVQAAVAGDDVALDTETNDAIGVGLAWVTAVAGLLSVGCSISAATLSRQLRRGAPDEVEARSVE